MCAQYHLLEVTAGDQDFLNCANIGIGGDMRIGSHSFLWCQGTKNKDLHSKCSLLLIENRFRSSEFFQSAASKNN